MQTKAFIGFWGSLIFTVLFLLSTEAVFSQQVIKLKTGQKYFVNIKSQSRDTLVYQLLSKPKVDQWILMEQVKSIKNLNPTHSITFPDTIPDKKKEELYYQNRELRNIGLGFVIGGAVVTGLGLAILIPAAQEWHLFSSSPEWAHDQLKSGAIITAIGAAGLITGTILAAVGGTKMKRYQIKHGISLDFKCTPDQKGLSLVYRF